MNEPVFRLITICPLLTSILFKENQMRSPDLEFRLKIEFLIWIDLETLNQISFEAKVKETIKI